MSTRSAFVSIVGRPNVGKSSLLNRLVGEKIAIISEKPQTTRNRITGILTKGEDQYVFFDTPGLLRPRNKLGRFMDEETRRTVEDVDVVFFMSSAQKSPVTELESQLLADIAKRGAPCVLVLNKIDLLEEKAALLPRIEAFRSLCDFAAVVPLSVLTGDGIELLMAELSRFASEGPHYFPDDALTDQPERVLLAELVREKALLNLRDEIPHGVAVVVEDFSERPDSELIDVRVTLYCEKASHKGMLIGKNGQMLKTIASQARLEAEALLGVHINLGCWVKVKENWRDSDMLIRNFGYQREE